MHNQGNMTRIVSIHLQKRLKQFGFTIVYDSQISVISPVDINLREKTFKVNRPQVSTQHF